MSPNLLISYNSSGGNGLLGVGFYLAGFESSIDRCGSSHVTDGHASGVVYSIFDKLCLDGQRLILSSGAHWSDGAIYHTENESFSKIIYKNGVFLVYARDGGLTRYAWKVEASGRIVRWLKSSEHDRTDNVIRYYYQHIANERWIPKEVVWTGKGSQLGNRKVVFTYKDRPDKRLSYDYGLKRESNHLIDTITTKIGSRKIKQYKFAYQKSPVSGLSRLRYIQQSGSDGGNLPPHYFTYNDVSRGFSSSSTPHKLPAYVYDYKDISKKDSCGSCNDGYSVEIKRGDFVDLDNDGFIDFVESYRGENSSAHTRNIYRNTGSAWSKIGQKPPVTIRDYYLNKNKGSGKGEMLQSSVYADVDGDGYEDIVTSYKNNGSVITEVRKNKRNFTFELPTATSFVPPVVMWDYDHLGKGKPAQLSHLIDVNGDALPDMVMSYISKSGAEYNRTYINNGVGWKRNLAYDFPSTAIMNDYRDVQNMDNVPVRRTEVIDINGDGLVDLIQGLLSPDKGVDKSKTYRKVWLNSGNGWTLANYYRLPDYIHDYTRINEVTNGQAGNDAVQRRGDFVDVNGDGLVDWVRSYRDFITGTDDTATWLNTGKGWVGHAGYRLINKEVIRNYSKTYGGDPHGPESGSFFDINRDGLVDWVVAHKNRNGSVVKKSYLNTGTGWAANNPNYIMPNILVDNVKNEGNLPMNFGGLMDVNGDGALDYLMSTLNIDNGPDVATYLGKAKPADMLIKVVDSLNAEVRIAYESMSSLNVYQSIFPLGEAHATHIENKAVGSSPLVSYSWHSDGKGGFNRLDYYYYGAGINRRRGSMGFQQRRIWNPQKKRLILRKYSQRYPTMGMMKSETIYTADSAKRIGLVPVNHKVIKYTEQSLSSKPYKQPSGKFTHAPRTPYSRVIDYELGAISSTPIRTVWTYTVYGAYNNPSTVTTITRAANSGYGFNPATDYRTINQYNYSNNETSWLIGLPTRVKTTYSVPNQPNQIRTTQMVYNGLGQLKEHVVEPYKSEYKITSTYDYDQFGNRRSTTVNGQGIDPRKSTVQYDSLGYHVVKKTNEIGHINRMTADPKCDLPKTSTDVNGLVTTYRYDQYCRAVRTDNPDSTWTTTSYSNSPYRITQNAKNAPQVVTYFDVLNREIKTEKQSFAGNSLVVRDKRYNKYGQISHESLPYYAGKTRYWTQYYYDALDRLALTRAPDNSESRISYQGLTNVTINALGQRTTQTNDLLYRPITISDAIGGKIRFRYDSVGNLIRTTDPDGNKMEMKYDHLGRKIEMNDPDMGIWKYSYNVLGELIKKTNAKGQIIRTNYDKLGRMISRTTNEGVSLWKYDSSTNGIGKLAHTTGPNGYRRQHSYDTLSRPTYTYETIDGVQARSYTSYDSNGKVYEKRYPGPKNGQNYGGQNRLIHKYNSRGYLKRLYDYKKVNGQTAVKDLWLIEKMDARGNITQERFGSGVSSAKEYHPTRGYLSNVNSVRGGTTIQDLAYWHDEIGNLVRRRDDNRGTNERFEYDDLNRLTLNITTPPANIGPQFQMRYNYDKLGNLTYRSDLGTLRYGERNFGPHAVTSVSKSGATAQEAVFNPYGWYNYDANGNLIQNKDRSIGWTSFNKPKQIVTRVNGQLRGASYTYNSDFQRIMKTTRNSVKTTRYFGGGNTEHISESNKEYWKYHISLGTTTLELKIEQTDTNSYQERENQYILKDHIGSTDVIVSKNGGIKQRLSFNPWGERRNANWRVAGNEIISTSTRGFTGHEMDDDLGVINMKARIYDPVIGRFLSADSIIPNMKSLQSYNRYSYVRNNPLSYVDPTGHARGDAKKSGGFLNKKRKTSTKKATIRLKHSPRKKSSSRFSLRKNGEGSRFSSRRISDGGMKNRSSSFLSAADTKVINYNAISVNVGPNDVSEPGDNPINGNNTTTGIPSPNATNIGFGFIGIGITTTSMLNPAISIPAGIFAITVTTFSLIDNPTTTTVDSTNPSTSSPGNGSPAVGEGSSDSAPSVQGGCCVGVGIDSNGDGIVGGPGDFGIGPGFDSDSDPSSGEPGESNNSNGGNSSSPGNSESGGPGGV